MSTTLQIDWTRCDGHKLCAALLPRRITRDEWGFPVLHDAPDDPRETPALRRAVATCPSLALRLAEVTPKGRRAP